MFATRSVYLVVVVGCVALGWGGGWASSAAGFDAGDVAPRDSVNWRAVDSALGRSGTLQPAGVYKFGIPRSDLTVRVGSVIVRPALALTAWVAFKEEGNATMAMGDLVLLESEVAPVLAALQAGDVQATAVHNHIFNESPAVKYVHFEGHGDATRIARTLRAALALTGTPPAGPAGPPPTLELDTARIAGVLGAHGKANAGVYQVSVARQEVIQSGGMTIPPAMGVATAINFQSTGVGMAAVTGDFVLIASEVGPVMRALGQHGIAVTALHSHMLTEAPRLLFMHFWANGDALELSAGLRAALKVVNVKPS